jgi:hypothetical protein
MAEQVGLTQLVGSWRLVSVGATYTDTKERIEFYGPHPTGYMALSPNGRVSYSCSPVRTGRHRKPMRIARRCSVR